MSWEGSWEASWEASWEGVLRGRPGRSSWRGVSWERSGGVSWEVSWGVSWEAFLDVSWRRGVLGATREDGPGGVLGGAVGRVLGGVPGGDLGGCPGRGVSWERSGNMFSEVSWEVAWDASWEASWEGGLGGCPEASGRVSGGVPGRAPTRVSWEGVLGLRRLSWVGVLGEEEGFPGGCPGKRCGRWPRRRERILRASWTVPWPGVFRAAVFCVGFKQCFWLRGNCRVRLALAGPPWRGGRGTKPDE